MRLRNVGLGLEAIKVQRNDVLFLSLVGKIEAFRKGKINQTTLNKSGINKVIQDATHIDATVKLTEMDWSAFVGIPKLDKNHPLTKGLNLGQFGDEDALSLLFKGNDMVNGWVDLETAKVHGDFRKIPVTVYLGENMFSSKKMSSQELAAIILHEIGHVSVYFEQMSITVGLNHAINASVQAMFAPDRQMDKVKIVDAYAKLRNVTFEEKDTLLTLESKEGVAAVMLQAEIQKSVSETGSNLYDATGFEFLSDQYSTRHGGGMALVTALDKLQRMNRDPVYRNAATFYSLEMLKTIGFFAAVSLGGPATMLLAMTVVATNPYQSTYDLPQDRADRIYRDLVEQLKNKKLDKETKVALTDDLEAIKRVTDSMKQRNSTLQLVWKVFSPTTRKQLKQKEAQQEIEKLLNNDMFVSAAKFSSLGA